MRLTLIISILLFAFPFFVNCQTKVVSNSGKNVMKDDIPTVDFCEMAKNPQLYFDKTIRITAVYFQADEGRYLSSDKCPLTHDEQIGAEGAGFGDGRNSLRNIEDSDKLNTSEYGNEVLITATGILRNSSMQGFIWYQYRFEINRFESVSPIIVPYIRDLAAGKFYRTGVFADKALGLSFAEPVRVPEHYAYRIEWTNLKEFPGLKKDALKSILKTIVFSVLSEDIKQMTANRWNITFKCKIFRVE